MDLASRGPSRRRFWSLVGPSPTTSRTSLELWPKFAAPVEAPLIKATRGRLKLNPAVPMVMLRSLGARSGEPREVPLAYFTDGDDVILIASNYGGTGHPAWYHKLRAHPECELHIGPRGGRFVARETVGNDPERLYRLAAERLTHVFALHEKRSGDRAIPVMRLAPAAD